MGNSLQIQVIVDASQVNAGMAGVTATVDAATARIKASFGSLANAPEGIQNALKVLQNSAAMSAETVTAATAAIAELGHASSAAAPQMQALGASTDQTTRSLTEARLAAQLLGREIGVTIPRGLTTVLARSETLGPALNAAFSAIAIAGFVQLAGVAADKISRLIADTYLFTDAEKAVYAQLVDENQKIIQLQEKHQQFQRDIAVIGLPLVEQERLRAQYAKEDQAGVEGSLKAKQEELALARQTLTALQQKKAAQAMPEYADAGMAGVDTDDTDEKIKVQEGLISSLSSSIEVLRNEYTLAGDAVTAANKKFDATGMKNSAEAAKKYQSSMEKLARELQHFADIQERTAEMARENADAENEFFARVAAKDTEESTKALAERQAADRAFTQDRLNDEQQAALTAISIREDQVKQQFSIGKISADQELQQLNALAKEKLTLEESALTERISTILSRLSSDDAKSYAEDIKEWSKLLSQKKKAEDQYLKERQKNTDSAANAEQKAWTQLTQKINSSFDQSVQGLIHGTTTWSKAFGSMVDSLLGDFTSFLLRKGEKWAEEQALELALHSSFLTNLLGLDTASQAAKQAVDSIAAASQVTQQAGIAGAAAFASVMASVPFPANVAAAPAAMSAAIATTMGNLALTSAAGGMETVPHDMLAMIHKDESVIPADFAGGLRNLVANGSGGGGHTFNYNPTIHGGGADVSTILKQSGKQFLALAMHELRKMNR